MDSPKAIDAAIATILDSIVEEYLSDPLVVFHNDQERLASYHAGLRKRRKDWKVSKTCMYPGCSKRSIGRSHTIPRAALQLLAEGGHLVCPGVSPNDGRLIMERRGLNEASTFPGFCASHEQIFQGFESVLKMRNDADYLLQYFRTVCREIAIKKHQLRHLAPALEEVKKLRDEWGRTRVEEEIVRQLGAAVNFKVARFELEGGDVLTKIEQKLSAAQEDLVKFKKLFFDPVVEALQTGRLRINLVYHAHDEILPVALAGRGVFHISDNGVAREVLAIMNVFPMHSGSTVFIAVNDVDSQAAAFYMNQFLGKEPSRANILRMVESWMLHGTDHWFLTPSIWDLMPPAQQTEILNAIWNLDLDIGCKPRVSFLS